MYAKLAINNAKRSIKDYIIYFVTLTICVSLFYAFMSLSSSEYQLITEDSYNFEMLQEILKRATYIVTGLLILLISYVNKYMIKRRKREFATYILLGTPQKNVAFMFFVEMLVMGIISIILGIFVGTLFSQAVTAIILMTAKQEIIFSFKLYIDTIMITFIFFISMFIIIGFSNIRVLNKIKLIDMINDEKKTEIQFKRSKNVYVIVFIMSILLYGLCGYCSYRLLRVFYDVSLRQGNEYIYAQLGLAGFIIGTYALFYSLSYVIIAIKERWTGFKYEYTNLFLIGSIVSKIKTAPILMATISLTFLGAALSFTLTLIMSQWSLGFLDYRIPYDIIINNRYASSSKVQEIEDIPIIDYSYMYSYFVNQDYGIEDHCEVEKYFITENDFYNSKENGAPRPLLAISLSDYKRLRKMLGYSDVELKSNEFTMQWDTNIDDSEIKDYINQNPNINIQGNKINISSTPYYKESIGEYIYNSGTYAILVLPDELCKDLTLIETDFYANTKENMSYDEALQLEKEYIPNWFKENYIDKFNNDNGRYPILTRVKVAETSEILNSTLAMRILGIYLGVVLLMLSLTVLVLQQLSDSIEHKGRFKTLKKLGIDNREINKLILKQLLLYFIIPIAIASIGFFIVLNLFSQMFSKQISVYIGDEAFIFNICIALLLIIIIYICYFASAYYTFKRNINDKGI